MRKQVSSAIPGYVYRLFRTTDDKSYVGSTIDLQKRRYTHLYLLRRNDHHCLHLQHAWNKYGESAFAFEVLEQMMIASDAELRSAESKYFTRFVLYNTSMVAGVVPPRQDQPGVLLVCDVAKWFTMSERQVRDMAQGGEIPATKVRGGWHFSEEEVRQWLLTRRTGPWV